MLTASTSGRASVHARPAHISRSSASHVAPSHHRRHARLHIVAAQPQKFSSFEEMIAGTDKMVAVDFYATWCGPCQMLSPILASVASNMKDELSVFKINTDKYPKIATQHKIEALPTIVLFKGGKPVDRIEGLPSQAQLTDRIKQALAKHR